jgi:cyclopropane-fatty-acyl-phospholipid synthase
MGMDTTRSLALTSSRESNHVPAAQRIFLEILNRKVQGASLAFRVAGSTFVVGNGTEPSRATVLVHNPRFFSRVVAHGNLGLGESYMDREFDVEGGKLDEFLRTLLVNRVDREISLSPGAALRVLWMRVADTLRGKENNIHRHYDTGIDLFTAFLGTNLVYSCGYVNEVTDSLDQLQINKMDRICRKLRLQSGERLLDIGCGYGGLLIHAAKNYGVLGTGVTNSRDHAACGNERIAEHGLNGRADIHYADFTTLQGTYDKVVSVGMMEHVPRREYKQYFRKLARLLSPQGMGLVHTLGANAPKNIHDPFFQKYIFPNSNQPKLSEITAGLESQGLAILDVENMIRHYGHTAMRWREHFERNRGQLNSEKYDDRFIRMWEYYLACGVAAAFASDTALYQVLFTKDYTAPMPLRRV